MSPRPEQEAEPGSRRVVGRVLASALLFDGSFYVIGAFVPLRAVAFGASALELGIMPVLGAGSYVGAALLGGRLADRWPRLLMARCGAALRALLTLFLLTADSTTSLLALLPLFGLVNGLFWPGLQAALPAIAGPRPLPQLLGAFNVAWSAGKMLGFVLGGVLVDRIGIAPPIWIAAVAGGLPALLLPSDRGIAGPSPAQQPDLREHGRRIPDAAGAAGERGTPIDRHPRPHDGGQVRSAILWRRIGWTSNFLLFGVGATLNYHYPKLLDARGLGGTEFGVFLGLAYLVQTLGFLLLSRWGGWHHRGGWLLGAQLLVAAALVVLPGLTAPTFIWALAPAIGAGLGLAYSSSLYYTLLVPGGHGRSTGLHEAVLASGSFLLPFLGGLAVRASSALAAPYLLVAGLILVGVALQGVWLRQARRC